MAGNKVKWSQVVAQTRVLPSIVDSDAKTWRDNPGPGLGYRGPQEDHFPVGEYDIQTNDKLEMSDRPHEMNNIAAPGVPDAAVAPPVEETREVKEATTFGPLSMGEAVGPDDEKRLSNETRGDPNVKEDERLRIGQRIARWLAPL